MHDALKDVPVEKREDVLCRFCSAPAVGKYSMSEGCFCHPEDRKQDLCGQHVIKATPLGSMELTLIYDPDFYEAYLNTLL